MHQMQNHISVRTYKVLSNLIRVVLIGLFSVMLIAALHPDVRTHVRGSLIKNQRVVISTVQADLAGDGTLFTVAKIRTQDALLLEIYEALADGTSRLVEKIEMADKKDGYFNFNGQATNLAVEDINGDGHPEILAPSFDHNLVGRLNIYSYNKSSKAFQRILQ